MTLIYDAARPVAPLDDVDALDEQQVKRNRAKVGSGRPSSLLYTYGPGAIMDLPQFTIMPTGLDDWDRIWNRRPGDTPVIHAPRLRDAVRKHMRSRDVQLREFPWQPKRNIFSSEGNDLGVPARVFPQWLRCTGCDLLGKVSQFEYVNTHPYRTDLARFEHVKCPGRAGSGKATRTAVPARYLLACTSGHLDEFPYEQWVHYGRECSTAGVQFPRLRMIDRTLGKGASAIIRCDSCGQQRPMSEAQGPVGARKLPRCRGRHPHLDAFYPGCRAESKLMLVGASNLWFPSTLSIIVMPESDAEKADDLVDRIRLGLKHDVLAQYSDQPAFLRALLEAAKVDVTGLSDASLTEAAAAALAPEPSIEEQEEELKKWDPVDLLVPEWRYLLKPLLGPDIPDPSGLLLSERERGPELRKEVTRVLAVNRLRKVNALTGFTRIDAFDRAGDATNRLVRLTRDPNPKWTVATEDRGEGIFLQLDEDRVAEWEHRVEHVDHELWDLHKESHRRNFNRRFSETAEQVDPDSRLRPPRYWLVHTLAHVLIREMAMHCGYQAASLSERLYAWPGEDDRPPAAGLLIVTTASDSDGTLGGLVSLSEPKKLERVLEQALERATRCSSDPICAKRIPADPEDFLHGAACHCCVMASETSCERANRFLDRKFLVNLPGSELGFFG